MPMTQSEIGHFLLESDVNTSYTLGLEFNGHTKEEVQNQIQEVKKIREVYSEAVILVLRWAGWGGGR